MLAVLVPSIVYVALIGGIAWPSRVPGLGIYVASAIFIFCLHDRGRPREPVQGDRRVGRACRSLLFFMFEKWFLVPLPKGPLEAWLGY